MPTKRKTYKKTSPAKIERAKAWVDGISREVDESFAVMSKAIQAGDNRALKAFMEWAAQFSHYSARNLKFLQDQAEKRGKGKGSALVIASYGQWQAMGYQVKEDEIKMCYRVFAPRFYPRKEGEDKDAPRAVKYYTLVRVYAHYQLDEDSERPLPDGQAYHAAIPALVDLLPRFIDYLRDEAGYIIEIHPRNELLGARGNTSGMRIRLLDVLSNADQFHVLLHELGHCLLHFTPEWEVRTKDRGQEATKLRRTLEECHAEACAAIVWAWLGLPDRFAESGAYIKGWGADPDLFQAQLEAVRKAAHRIILMLRAALGMEDPELLEEAEEMDDSELVAQETAG